MSIADYYEQELVQRTDKNTKTTTGLALIQSRHFNAPTREGISENGAQETKRTKEKEKKEIGNIKINASSELAPVPF